MKKMKIKKKKLEKMLRNKIWTKNADNNRI